MNLPDYNTAEQLGISQRVVDALIWVRDSLRNGTIERKEHVTGKIDIGNVFNISVPVMTAYDRTVGGRWPDANVRNPPQCGTIACIGGWAAIQMLGRAEDLTVPVPINDANDDRLRISAFVNTGDEKYINMAIEEIYMDRGRDETDGNPLYDLFFPSSGQSWSSITPSVAAWAVDLFFRGYKGRELWDKAFRYSA